jgi:hypothetical protein
MTRRMLLLILAVPSLALAADVVPSGRLRVVASQPAKPATPKAAIPPSVGSPAPVPADGAQCRIGCADSYYVCRTSPRPEDCAPAWSQCVAACDAPNLDFAAAVDR